MKLALLAVCVGAFLAVPGIAASKTLLPARLSGSATVNGSTVAIGVGGVTANPFSPYDGAGNDLSGTCNVDPRGANTVFVNNTTFSVVCAHYVVSSGCCSAGSQKMRFAYQVGPTTFYVVRITDNGAGSPDTLAYVKTKSFEDARSWVNTGANGSGRPSSAWTVLNMTSGDFGIEPPQFT
jgi:hypothetical protein